MLRPRIFGTVVTALFSCAPPAPRNEPQCEDGVDLVRACGDEGEHADTTLELEALSGCTHYRGHIHVSHAGLESLNPLASLVEVEGNIVIFSNHELEDLRALARLRRVGGRFSLRHDDSGGRFTTLNGPGCLSHVGSLLIESTPVRTLDGLRSLRIVHGDLAIRNNSDLPLSEVKSFMERVEVGGSVTLEGNGP